MNSTARSIILVTMLVTVSGCTSLGKKWRELLTGDSGADRKPQSQKSLGATFSENNNLQPNSYRQYKRKKRRDLENDAHLDARSGSLWVMEGQGAYLFSQNIVRMIGDAIPVRIEGDPLDQLNSKSNVISKLLAQFEERRRRALGRGPAGKPNKEGEKAAGADPAAASDPAAANPAAAAAASAAPSPDGESKSFTVKMVPARVVERLVDGNYRVRGTQPFMIGQREYKVIVTGIVRAEDFSEDGIDSSRLMDSHFDIVSSKSTEARQ